MAKEIERKFLVTDKSYIDMATASRRIVQGYVSRDKTATVRVRISDDRAYLTLKGITTDFTRDEWEYEIPLDQAREMLRTICSGAVIDKTRYLVPFEGYTWEVDEFHNTTEPLTLAEVELPDAQAAPQLPPFIGAEVTGNPAYYNSNLATHPLE